VRYIGSKSRLLGFIEDVVREQTRELSVACDIFAGTAAVASLLKRMGLTVVCNDVMEYSLAFQVAAVEACEYPRFKELYSRGIVSEARAEIEMVAGWSPLGSELPDEAAFLAGVVNHLNGSHWNKGFFWNHFSADNIEPSPYRPSEKEQPEEERMFFTSENAQQIDGVRTLLEEWREEGWLTRVEYYILLAALIDAADVAANTTGVYGAYLKEFGRRQERRLELRVPRLGIQQPAGPHRTRRGDALECAGEEKFDLLYMDPPYNRRDYAANYHVPELIARGWFEEEPTIEGKTGLVKEFVELRSDFCLKDRCVEALEQLVNTAVKSSGVRYILLSYNSEGLIPDEQVERIFKSAGSADTYRRFTRDYKRYRSDSDSADRAYKRDRVDEFLYFVEVDR
jgi:adenine-specific DNA-methyltransferase